MSTFLLFPEAAVIDALYRMGTFFQFIFCSILCFPSWKFSREIHEEKLFQNCLMRQIIDQVHVMLRPQLWHGKSYLSWPCWYLCIKLERNGFFHFFIFILSLERNSHFERLISLNLVTCLLSLNITLIWLETKLPSFCATIFAEYRKSYLFLHSFFILSQRLGWTIWWRRLILRLSTLKEMTTHVWHSNLILLNLRWKNWTKIPWRSWQEELMIWQGHAKGSKLCLMEKNCQ